MSQQPEQGNTSLDLGELQQVLQDEELARRLQEEEKESLLGGVRDQIRWGGVKGTLSLSFVVFDMYWLLPTSGSSYPEGDFRVAQVAQDEVGQYNVTAAHVCCV